MRAFLASCDENFTTVHIVEFVKFVLPLRCITLMLFHNNNFSVATIPARLMFDK